MRDSFPMVLFVPWAMGVFGSAGTAPVAAASFEIVKPGPDVEVLLRVPVPDAVKVSALPGEDIVIPLTDEDGKEAVAQVEYADLAESQLELVFVRPRGYGVHVNVGKRRSRSGAVRNRVIVDSGNTVSMQLDDRLVARYQLGVRKLAGHPKHDNANFFHPLGSPMGVIVTDDGPDDHLHHRGLFLSFKKFAWTGTGKTLSTDFWHPHQHEGTRIAAGKLHYARGGPVCSALSAGHDYWIDDQAVLTQDVVARAANVNRLNVLDVDYTITAKNGHVVLGENFYSCLQFRGARGFKREDLIFTYADGREHDDVDAHKEPPPYDRWFDLTGKVDGRLAGATTIVHPSTPGSRLCYARGVKGLNANFLFDGPVELKKDQSLRCKYQILIHDGTVERAEIAPVADWYNPGFQVKWSK